MPEVDVELWVKGPQRTLLYGPAGTGKTWLACSSLLVPEMCPVAIFDCDGGLEGAATLIKKAKKGDVSIYKMTGVQDIRDLLSAVMTGKVREKTFKTVVLDSLSEFHAMLMEKTQTEAGRADRPTQIQDYRDVTDSITRFLTMIRRKSLVHFVCTAGETATEDSLGGGVYLYPGLSGKLPMRIVHHFHFIGYLSGDVLAKATGSVKVERTLQVQPVQRRYAKDRLSDGKLGVFVKDPTMKMLYDAFYAEGAPVFASEDSEEEKEESSNENQL